MFKPQDSFARSVKQLEKQADRIELMDELASHNVAMRELAANLKDLLWYLNPNVKWWGDTLTNLNTVILRYEKRSHLYMAVPVAGMQCLITAFGIQQTVTLNQGWNAMNYPEGTQLNLITVATVPVIFFASNSTDVIAIGNISGMNLEEVNGKSVTTGASDGNVAANVMGVIPLISNGNTAVDRWRGINGINDNTGFGTASVGPLLFNAVSGNWERQRDNQPAATIITAASVSSTQTSSDQTNYNGRGVTVYLNVTTIGTGSLVVTIQYKDDISGTYFTALASAAVVANGVTAYTVYPGATPAANLVASIPLPRTWRVQVTGANSSSFTVNAETIL